MKNSKDMNLNELIKNGANVSIMVSLADLAKLLDMAILRTKNDLEQCIIDQKTERYLSPIDTAKLLCVDPSTLYRWRKKKYLVPSEVGGELRYKHSDIIAMLEGKNKGGE